MQTYENGRLASHCGSITLVFMEPNAFPGIPHADWVGVYASRSLMVTPFMRGHIATYMLTCHLEYFSRHAAASWSLPTQPSAPATGGHLPKWPLARVPSEKGLCFYNLTSFCSFKRQRKTTPGEGEGLWSCGQEVLSPSLSCQDCHY